MVTGFAPNWRMDWAWLSEQRWFGRFVRDMLPAFLIVFVLPAALIFIFLWKLSLACLKELWPGRASSEN